MNVAEMILARGESEARAVAWGGGAVTYGELRQRVGQLGAALLARGCAEGERVGIWSENSPFFVASYLGVIQAGLVAVPFQTETNEATFGRIAYDAGIKQVLVSRRFLKRVRPWAERSEVEVVGEGGLQVPEVGGNHGWTRMDTEPGNAECVIHSPQSTVHSPQSTVHSPQSPVHGSEAEVQSPKSRDQSPEATVYGPQCATHGPGSEGQSLRSQVSGPKSQVRSSEVKGKKGAEDKLAALMFTSGTTGAPKGVMVSHLNIECNTRDIISYIGLGPDDRGMVVLPFHYCFGLSLLHSLLMAGGTVVINNDFKLYPEAMLQDLERNECTGLAGVPSTYQILLRKSRFGQMALPKLRWLQQAGGKLANACIKEILEVLPHVRFYLMYGQTEGTARLSYLPPDSLGDKLGSIGKGLPSTRLEVVRRDGSAVGERKAEGRRQNEERPDRQKGPLIDANPRESGGEPRNTRKEVEREAATEGTEDPTTEGNEENEAARQLEGEVPKSKEEEENEKEEDREGKGGAATEGTEDLTTDGNEGNEAARQLELEVPHRNEEEEKEKEEEGEVGEIVASGDNIALGYWNDATETARYFRDGMLYTGDLAQVDRDGFIFIVEREREMIKSGGNRVGAKEVEEVIAELAQVVEVAVVGTPHELLGEAIQAFVVPKIDGGVSAEEVIAHCRGRLPAFKVPAEVIFLNAMPHNSSGKILKTRLREKWGPGVVRAGSSSQRLD